MLAAAFCSVLALVGPQDKSPEQESPDKPAELKVLDHYVGDWAVQFTKNDFPLTNGKASAKWILGGRFLEQTSEATGNDGTKLQFKTLFSYDRRANVYRVWNFSSDGSATESEGTWDAKTKTMTSITRKNESGGRSTTTADFSKPGVETWKIIVADAGGNVLAEITGKNTRTKK